MQRFHIKPVLNLVNEINTNEITFDVSELSGFTEYDEQFLDIGW
jgi:hypothetical protein